MQQCRSELSWLGYEAERRPAANTMYSLSSGVGLFLCSSKWGGAVLQYQKWGGAVLQISVETSTILCQAIRRSCQSYTLQILAYLEERRDGAVSRVVSVFFCAVYIVLLGQCYVAMPSGYKLVITRELGLHGIYNSYRLSPRSLWGFET